MLRKLALLLISVLTSLLVLEGAVRLLLPRYSPEDRFRHLLGTASRPPLGVPNTVWRHVDKAGDFDVEVRINALGLRDDGLVAAAGPTDILLVGDSFAMGLGVSERQRFSDRLAERLGVAVFNAALPGDLQSYDALLNYCRALGAKSQRILVAVYPENDLGTYEGIPVLRPEEVDLSTPGPPMRPEWSFGGLKRWLNHHSAAYLAVTTLVRSQPTLERWARRLGLSQPFLSIRLDYAPEEFRGAAAYLARSLEGLDAVVVLVPSRRIWIGGDPDRFRAIHHRFAGKIRGTGLRLVDLLPAFDAEPAPERLYFPHDGHWNAAGHALAATVIADRLPDPWVPARRASAPRP